VLTYLADDLGGTLGEVQGEGCLIGAEIIDVEDELCGKVFVRAPYHPADSRINLVDQSQRYAYPLGKQRSRTKPYLCPETLMETTFSRRKSHSKPGLTKGTTKPPLAAST